MMMKRANKIAAFTLVELSIVLVILGLLVGGVLTGQSLIHAAELRSVTTQEQHYVTAVQTFRDKYFALPGDMTNAIAFWGAAPACPGDASHIGTGTQTCNGDGDGVLSAGAVSSFEPLRFWQHLANAGLIEGNYDGVSHSISTTANSPSGRISGSLWYANGWGNLSGAAPNLFDGQYGNMLLLGTLKAADTPGNPTFKPEDVYNIDMKLDDGMPATGSVVVYSTPGFSSCTSASASTTLTATYLLSATAIACNPVFRNAL